MSRTFFPMMLTVFAAVTIYYLLSTKTSLSENLNMTVGVVVGVLGAVISRKLFNKE